MSLYCRCRGLRNAAWIGCILAPSLWPCSALAVSISVQTFAVDCGHPVLPNSNPDLKSFTGSAATTVSKSLSSDTNKAHAQAAASASINVITGVVSKSATGTSWLDAGSPTYDSKAASWSASASGTVLLVEGAGSMAPFQFAIPLASELSYDSVGYDFNNPAYPKPALQGFKRDAIPATVPASSFLDITIMAHAAVHQDGDETHPAVDFTFLNGGYLINSAGQVTQIGTLPPPADFHQGTVPGMVDLSFHDYPTPIVQLRPGVPFQLTTDFTLQMGSGGNSTLLSLGTLANPLGGGGSFTSTFNLRDPSFTLFAVDPSMAHWNSSGGGSWADPSNWGTVPNGINTTVDFANRDITTDTAVTLDGNFTAGNLRFADLVPSNNWTLSAGAPSGTLTLKVTSGSPNIDVANLTARPPTNSSGGTSAGFVSQSATINAPIAGKDGLTKTGAGTLILAGQNTYTGPMTVKQGQLTLDFSAASGGLTSDIIKSGSALVLGGSTVSLPMNSAGGTLMVQGANSAITSQSFISTTIDTGYNSIVLQGSVPVTLNLGALSHIPGGTVNFVLPSAGNINTTTPNTNGIFGGWATVTTTSPTTSTVDWAAVDSQGNIMPFSGYLVPSGPNPAIGSNPGANVMLDGTSSGNASVAGVTNLNTLAMNDAVSRSVNIASGSGLIFGATGGILKSNALDNHSLSINGGFISAAGELHLVANGSDVMTDNIIVNSSIVDNGTPLVLVKSGTGAASLTGSNTYTGGTLIEAGRLTAGSGNALGTGAVVVASGAQLYVGGTVPNSISISGNGTSESGGLGALRIQGAANLSGVVTLQSDARISSDTTTSQATFNGKITGPFNLEFGGGAVSGVSRSFVLNSSANDYTGNTTISGATLRAGVNNAIPNGAGKGNLILNGIPGVPTPLPAVFDLHGMNQTINGLSSAPGTGSLDSVITSGGAATLTVGNNNANGSFAGTISGTLVFIKDGTGTQTLGGSNTYTGGTTVKGGTLALARANGLSGIAPLTLLSGSTFATGGFNQNIATLSILGQSTIDFGAGSSILHFNNVPTWNGTLRISNWTNNPAGPQLGGGPDRLLIGSGGTVTLGSIQFDGFDPGATILANGEVVPLGLPYMMADFNRDTLITAADVPVMLGALSDPAAFMQAQSLEADELLTIGDINHDGVFDNHDIQPLLDMAAAGAGAVDLVPEPAAALLAAFGLLGLFAFRRQRR